MLWSIVLLVINIMLFILIASKFTQFNNIYQENLRVQHGIESLVERNSQLVNVILDELEEKLNEANIVIDAIEQRVGKVEPVSGVQPIPPTETPTIDYPEEVLDLDDKTISPGAKVVYMKKMGFSVQDIAQKMNVSQGEIALKLNLQSQDPPLQKQKGRH